MTHAGETKRCPSCSRDMPSAAASCTSCAYDFTESFFPGAVFPTTNRLAVASLVLGILWLLGLGSVAAVILGHRALDRITAARGREAGRGMALTGLVLGYLGIASAVLLLVLLLSR